MQHGISSATSVPHNDPRPNLTAHSSEACALNLKQPRIWVRRGKNSLDTERPIEGDELRAIKRYLTARTDKLPWLLISERGQPLTRQAVNYLIAQAGSRAGLGDVWPHMLRHSAGYALSNRGHDFRLLQDFMGPAKVYGRCSVGHATYVCSLSN